MDTWRAAYRGIVPEDYLADLSCEESERLWLDRLTTHASGVFVVEDDRRIFGFASGRPRREFSKGLEDYGGEFETVYVLPESRGSGAGKALVAAIARYLIERDISSGLLWVFEENRLARSFYESLGGARIREVAYGWKDLGALLSRASSPPPSAR